MKTPPERETVQALWDESSRRLHAWFERRTGSAHDADDLVQETFLRAHSRIASLREGERLGAWIGAIAANVLADHGRSRARGGVSWREADPAEAALDVPAPDGDGSELAGAVAGWTLAFLARLDPEDARLLRAVEIEGRAQADVAKELGLSPSGARSRVQRARARLRRHLEACCRFAFDARGNPTRATRRPNSTCACDDA